MKNILIVGNPGVKVALLRIFLESPGIKVIESWEKAETSRNLESAKVMIIFVGEKTLNEDIPLIRDVMSKMPVLIMTDINPVPSEVLDLKCAVASASTDASQVASWVQHVTQ